MKTNIPAEARRYLVPMSYLHKGTAFIAKTTGAGIVLVSGVAAMDGHAVSDNYGLRKENPYYASNPERNYINVWFDGVNYGKHPVDSDEHGNRLDINSGMYEKDGWSFYVDKAAWVQYKEDLKWKPVSDEEQKREARKAHLVSEMERLKKEIEDL